EIEAVRILDPERLVVRAVMVGDRSEPALLELPFHFVGVPWLDAPGEPVEHGMDRRAVDAESGVGDRGRRRRGQAAANVDAARVLADVEQRLLAVVAPD